jgi:hypothetical protein
MSDGKKRKKDSDDSLDAWKYKFADYVYDSFISGVFFHAFLGIFIVLYEGISPKEPYLLVPVIIICVILTPFIFWGARKILNASNSGSRESNKIDVPFWRYLTGVIIQGVILHLISIYGLLLTVFKGRVIFVFLSSTLALVLLWYFKPKGI